MEGQGVYICDEAQEIYSGQFGNGKRDGFGFQKYRDGDIVAGDWKDDELVTIHNNSQCSTIYECHQIGTQYHAQKVSQLKPQSDTEVSTF